jgi:cell wall-associated NlpC family hydrolase
LNVDGIVGPATEAALQPQPQIKTKTEAIIATAKEYIGTPYLWGGITPAGFDCSGFVQYVFAHNGIMLQRVSSDQSKNGNEVTYGNLMPGDLVFFSMNENGVVSHVGLYIGNDQFIGSENSGVRIVTLDQYWVARFVVARSVY